MTNDSDMIEVSAPVKLEACATFWIERGKWDAMTGEERQRALEDAANEIECSMDNHPFAVFGRTLNPSLYATVSEIGPGFGIYDPQAEG